MKKLADITMFESIMGGGPSSGNMVFNGVSSIGPASVSRFVLFHPEEYDGQTELRDIMEAAERGDTGSQVDLGHIYCEGSYGVERDLKKGAEWYLKAAKKGDSEAQKYLGWAYFDGEGVEKNVSEAERWLRKAGKQDELANYHAEILRVLLKAEKGKKPLTANEMSFLGYSYFDGDLLEPDMEKAREWFEKAAAEGDETSLGYLEEFWGVQDSPAVADEPQQKTDENKDSQSQYEMGLRYWRGSGVKHDPKKAFWYFQQAAAQGHVAAQLCLGVLLFYGEGVEKNQEEAVRWLGTAMDNGLSMAKDGFTTAEESLSGSSEEQQS